MRSTLKLAALAAVLATAMNVPATAGTKRSCCGSTVSGPVTATPIDESTPPKEAELDLASSFDVASAPAPLAPNMIGDSLGVPMLAGTDLVLHRHLTKVADNNSVLPQDRVGVAYNLYHNAPILYGAAMHGGNLDEFRFLGEKTFLSGLLSAQVTLPFAHTVASEQNFGAVWGNQTTEIGNLAITLKGLLYQDCRMAISSGLLVELPTADDISFPGTNQVVKNDAWYLTPFGGLLLTPNDRLFSQSFISYRAATDDNTFLNGPVILPLRQSQNMLMIDTGVGYWVYRDPCGRGLTGLAPTLELHYSTTTEDADQRTGNPAELGRVDYLNLTAGCTAEINRNVTLATGLILPLREKATATFGQTDRTFDWELALQLNVRFGASKR